MSRAETRQGPLPLAHAGFPPGSLPTRHATLGDAEVPWPETTGRRAAVLMLFIPPPTGERDARVVLTRRSTQVRSHRGQVGFPGGRADEGDASPAATALRELSEELGVDPAQVVVFGALPPVAALDGSPVHPILGAAPFDLTAFKPSPAEVEAVFADSWRLFQAGAAKPFRFNILGRWRESLVFGDGGRATCPVWGLTAQVLQAASLRP